MNLRICIAVVVFVASFMSVRAQQPRPSAAQKEQETAGKSIIRGRVTYADTGRPLRRAEVHLIEQATDDWRDSSVTDRNGEFVFRKVSAGKYFVAVTAADIVSPSLQIGRRESLRFKIALGQIEDGFSEVTVDGRSSVKTEIRASRGGVITGRVLTDADEPIAKAKISLFRVEKDGARSSSWINRAYDNDKWRFETDSRGIYRIAGLATGDYIVRASESDEGGDPDDASEGSYTDGSMMAAFYPTALRAQDATSVKVQQGTESTDVDIRIPDRIGHRVSGTVLFRGRPTSYTTVKLTSDDAEMEANRYGSNQNSNANTGYWEIRNVPDGNYTLVISGTGGHVRSSQDDGFVSVIPLRRKLVVEGGDVTNLKFELTEGGTVAGVVSIESGTQKLEQLRLELVLPDQKARGPVDGEEIDNSVGTAFVKENGMFSVSGVPSGSFHFRLSGLGNGVYVKSITFDGKDVLRNPLKTVEGKLVDGVRIVLSSDLVTRSGRAVERSNPGKPLTNATILLFHVEEERRRVSDGPITLSTDKAGRFVVKAPPGEYFVFVVDRTRKEDPLALPTEANLIKNSSTLQKINLQRREDRVVEVVGP